MGPQPSYPPPIALLLQSAFNAVSWALESDAIASAAAADATYAVMVAAVAAEQIEAADAAQETDEGSEVPSWGWSSWVGEKQLLLKSKVAANWS
jgi:hypothetical protein